MARDLWRAPSGSAGLTRATTITLFLLIEACSASLGEIVPSRAAAKPKKSSKSRLEKSPHQGVENSRGEDLEQAVQCQTKPPKPRIALIRPLAAEFCTASQCAAPSSITAIQALRLLHHRNSAIDSSQIARHPFGACDSTACQAWARFRRFYFFVRSSSDRITSDPMLRT